MTLIFVIVLFDYPYFHDHGGNKYTGPNSTYMSTSIFMVL